MFTACSKADMKVNLIYLTVPETEKKLKMRGKAQCDSPILVLLAPSGEYD